jgi:integrase
MLVAVLRLLIEWGIALEYSESNPCTHVRRLETNPEGARPWPSWAFKLIDETGREDIKRAVLLARYTGQRQADVLRMNHKDIEDGGILVTQQKTGKELWVPLHPALKDALEGWSSSPYVVTGGASRTPQSDSVASGHTSWSTHLQAGSGRRVLSSTGSARPLAKSSARQVAEIARSRLSPVCRPIW